MKQQRLLFKVLALLLFSLFLLLAVYGGYIVLTYGNRWFSSSKNPRVRAQKEAVIAGSVLDRNGVVLASTDAEGSRRYHASSGIRSAVVHLLGDAQGRVSNGVETFQSNYLYGFQASFPELVMDLLRGEERRGDNVTLTVDSRLCQAAAEAFDAHESTNGKSGAVVVMNWKTGEVLAMTSLPSFDPSLSSQVTDGAAGQPYWNRATQALYPPGSTFKLVTAATALSQLPEVETRRFECAAEPMNLDGNTIQDYQGGSHGMITLRQGLTQSCNKLFASLALELGQRALRRGAEDFGFNDNFLFRDLVVENSGFPTTAARSVELAASGFGQSSVTATPMHLCMIAAGIARGGVMPEPRLLRQVDSPGGVTRLTYTSADYRTATTPEIADKLRAWMRDVVLTGTGRRAEVEGLTVCGKTGTSDSTSGGQPIAYGWFAGFAAEESMPVAVCVLVEGIEDGVSGGSSAALIAGDVLAWCSAHRGQLISQDE